MVAVTRRDLLKGLCALGGVGLWPMPGISRLVFGAESAAPMVVVVHLRGGWDGLNLLSPASDPDFIAARGAALRVLAEGQGAGYAIEHGPDARIDFRLHPQAGGLAELYKQGHLAFIHACGLTRANRSHFVATDMIERGVASEALLARIETGWLTRGLVTHNPLRAISVKNAVDHDLTGTADALAIANLGRGVPPLGGPGVMGALARLYERGDSEIAVAGRIALKTMATLDQKLPRDPKGRVQPYQPRTDSDYGPAADFGHALKTVAQLIKLDVGLEAITLDYGGWDTHEAQPATFRPQVDRLSQGLAQFWNDVNDYHDRLTVVLISEFGRRLRANKSNGTDHGRGGLMAVLGGKVAGGRCYGPWPGLKNEQLEEGVDLAVATDYRRVLTEVLVRHTGAKTGNWFPEYSYPGPLGLFGGRSV